jgi:hypothetical protein
MNVSLELQRGKAGEHFVCCDLIRQGFSAFLADQGLPYDVLVDTGTKIFRMQVKTTGGLVSLPRAPNIYRFGTRRAKGGISVPSQSSADFWAFVALDIYAVAYIPASQMLARSGSMKQTVDFKSRLITYTGRVYSNGAVRTPAWGKHLQDFGKFQP